ncbi:MAG: nitrous oxide reductase accessory protein NosL [Saprospiraceae bacterium]|nr:nitrous oxide reductase accessory protein NosL [Saprospiraceae bacterium]
MSNTFISNRSRWIVFAMSLSLLLTYFVPVWRIDLFAPQYPEGLTMKIWLKSLTGDVEIINGLNHYIGMRHISVEMFPEFEILIYIVAFYILLGLLVAYAGRLNILFWYLVFTAFGGVFSMYDFYRWGYEYGHNLDPTAAIKVPGLSYQPPLLGHKRLLNFDAYSQPDIGGWIIFVAATIMALVWLYEWNQFRKKSVSAPLTTMALVLGLGMISCEVKPEPFKYGTDICYTCKMGIVDRKFGSEIVTEKGKVYKFDDIGCMIRLMKSGTFDQQKLAHVLVMDYEKENNLLDVNNCKFVYGEDVRTPMNFNTAAFESELPANNFARNGQDRHIVDWKYIYKNIE